jgi:dihydroorotase
MTETDVYIQNGRFHTIGSHLTKIADHTIDAKGMLLLPGVIDDQVHFREPGLTHKANIASESRAALAGGITSFMEMPNTAPPTLTQELLADKYEIASRTSPANYSFYMGVSNDNYDEVMRTDPKTVCGLKIFMGSSTGNMLVDDEAILERIFANAPTLIATHCEDEATIRTNMALAREKYGENVPVSEHPTIRSAEACYLSSSKAVALAKKNGTRLHILHISTETELDLFDNQIPLTKKRITAEACIHHLWFSDEDYARLGNFIKWNPAVKKASDREAVWRAVLDNRIDVIATDHAPHTLEEKSKTDYFATPSGGPLVQHALVAMLEKAKEGQITIERIVEKMCHAPAILFQIQERGFIREGYFADAVLVDLNRSWTVSPTNILYHCGWSPFEGQRFSSSVLTTIVNGIIKYHEGKFIDESPGMRLAFAR